MRANGFFVAAAIALLLVVTAPATAGAAQGKRCGNYGSGGWTSAPIDGTGVRNLTARGASCRFARWLAFNAFTKTPYTARTWSAHGWTCRFLARRPRVNDIRCRASGDRSVRWQNHS